MFNTVLEQKRLRQKSLRQNHGSLTHQFGGGFGRTVRIFSAFGRAASTPAGRKGIYQAAKAVTKTSKPGRKAIKGASKVGKRAKKSKLNKVKKKTKKKKKKQKAIGYQKKNAIMYDGGYSIIPQRASRVASKSAAVYATTKTAKKTKKPLTKWQKRGRMVRNAAATAALTGAVSSGVELGLLYGGHKAMGGETPSKRELKQGVMNASVGIANEAAKGNLSSSVVKQQTRKAVKETLARANKRAGKSYSSAPKSAKFVLQQMKQVYDYMKRQKQKKRKSYYRGLEHRIHGARAFGTGAGRVTKKYKKKKSKSKKGKKGKGGKKKSTKKGKRGRMNVSAAARKYQYIRDVFD